MSLAFATSIDPSQQVSTTAVSSLADYTFYCLNGTISIDPNVYVGIGYVTSGNYVKVLQANLSWMYKKFQAYGIDPGAIDGQFGSQTYTALFNFQNITEGLTADGIAGPKTWVAINSLYKSYERPVLQFYK